VAYYSFQKRKEFSFGSFVATTVKRNDSNPQHPGKEMGEA